MITLIYILLATILISLGSFVGSFTLSLNKKLLEKIVFYLVALSAGVLFGGAFLHLLPKASEQLAATPLFLILMISYIFFLVIETFLHWHHCHEPGCPKHSTGWMNLLGDSIHNFIDGLIIAAAFLSSPQLGIVATIAVAIHEIPQEISDFGVLIHSGFERTRALILNFGVALVVVAGGLVGFVLADRAEALIPWLLPFAAGGFLYVATSDLIPQIKQDQSLKKSLLNLGIFGGGILLMAILKLVL